MKTEAEKQKIYEAQKRKYEEIIKRPKPHQETKTTFAKERLRALKNLKEAQEDLLIENLPEEVYTNEYVMDAKKLIGYVVWTLEKLEEKVGKGYGWTLTKDYLPVHNTDVLVSLDEDGLMTLARYHKDKGFLLDIDGDYVVKAWCEIPEWYDWENDEEERELTKEERKQIAADFEYDALKEEGRI